jgi:beta-N-acetylhexosaminidase
VGDDTLRRRRRWALGIIAGAAAAGGALVGAAAGGRDDARSATTDPPAPQALQGLTPAQEAGSVIVLQFTGTAAPAYVRRALRQRRAAGAILFRHNIASPAQLRRLTRSLQRAARGRALLMLDQEGGEIRNISWAPPTSPPSSIRTASGARANGRGAAGALRRHGLNVNLAPVADVASIPDSVMRTRAFPGDGTAVARLVRANLRGYAGTGVLPTVKHFPGLGASAKNTDFASATVARLGAGDLRPFRAAIAAGVPLVMSSHALYPQLDGRRIASQSPVILEQLLRGRLGFEGAVITDSLEARAVLDRSSTPTAAARSLLAGNDLLLTTGRGSYLKVRRRLVAEAGRSAAFRARLREALVRVEALRARLAP